MADLPGAATVNDIAIIGLACELPGGITTSEQFWDTLCHGRNHCSKIPSNRWNADGFYREGATKAGVHKVQHAHFLERDIAAFDAPFFRITANEANAMDPQQRLLLETAYRAFENAGLALEDVAGSDTCAYMGTFTSDYSRLLNQDAEQGAMYWATGTGTAIAANRLSWFFDLKGPSTIVDTGCSASLLALHLACQSILSGESSMGLAGGCNLILDPNTMVIMSDSGFLSSDGRSHSFDARGNGYGRGEGFAMVVVKRLSDALRDGDTIRAVIRATGVNHDGFTPGIAQPNSESQEALIRDTYRKAGLGMSETRYFEAHGTGTPVGDPIEARAIRKAFERAGLTPEKPLIITALKANIGHLEATSGVASVVKTILALEKGVVPPIAHLENLNPAISIDPGIIFAREPREWPTDGLRRASINSFGYGGTNVHVVLDDAGHYLEERGLGHARHSTSMPRKACVPPKRKLPRGPKLLVLSAADKAGVQRTASALEQARCGPTSLASPDDDGMADLTYTLSEKRTRFPWRSYAILPSDPSPETPIFYDIPKPLRAPQPPPRLTFVFTGQGATWATMGAQLMTYAPFRQSLATSETHLLHLGSDWSLVEELHRPRDTSRLDDARLSQPICTALQLALVDLLWSWHVYPETVLGHSSGEIAAAYCAGALTRHAALRVAYSRGVVADLAREGFDRPAGMMVVATSATVVRERARELLGPCTTVAVACVNSDRNVTLSGYLDQLERLGGAFEQEGVFTRVVKTGVPYHSDFFMTKVASVYEGLMKGLEDQDASRPPGARKVKFVSSTLAKPVPLELLATPSYWVQNLLRPVEFSAALSMVLKASPEKEVRKLGVVKSHAVDSRTTHIVEVGPHFALRSAIGDVIRNICPEDTVTYSSTLHRHEDSCVSMLRTAGDLFTRGYDVDLLSANNLRDVAGDLRMLTELPGYSFDHTSRYWLETRRIKQFRQRQHGYHDLLGMRTTHGPSHHEARWTKYISLEEEEDQWVADHEISGVVIYPAAGLLVMALEAARQLADAKPIARLGVQNVTVDRALILASGTEGVETEIHLHRQTKASRADHRTTFQFSIRAFSGEDWFECCRGWVMVEYQAPRHEVEQWTSLDETLARHQSLHDEAVREADKSLDSETIYRAFSDSGLKYGPSFRALNGVLYGASHATTELDGRHWTKFATNPDVDAYVIHPSTLDNMLQLALIALSEGRPSRTLVPTKFSKLWISPPPTPADTNGMHLCHAQAWTTGFRGVAAELSALNSDRDVVTVECSFEATSTADSRPETMTTTTPTSQVGLCYLVDWKPHLATMPPADLAQYCRPRGEDLVDLRLPREQTRAAFEIMEQAIWHSHARLTGSERYAGKRGHLQHYVAFLGKTRQRLDRTLRPVEDLDGYIGASAAKHSPLTSGLELAIRVAKHLPSILTSETDPLALLFSDDLLTRYYADIINATLAHGVEHLADLLAHNRPTLRVLEVGAGTGSASRHVLQALARNGDSRGGSFGARFERYCYTDVSPSFFTTARGQFVELLGEGGVEKMEFKVLDVEREPGEQGFVEGDFDLVVAANVVHATADVGQTLEHLKWLLKPGGKLLLFEITQPEPSRATFVFGLLPGWWLNGGGDGGTEGPLLTTEGWDARLKGAGFTGIDVALRDDEEPFYHFLSMIVSSKPEKEMKGRVPTVVIASRSSPFQQMVADGLRTPSPEVLQVDLEDAAWNVPAHSVCIFTPELDQNVTGNMSSEGLRQLQKLFSSASTIVWLANSEGRGSEPSNGLAMGMSRVVRSENPQLQVVHLMVDVARGAGSVVGRVHQVLAQIPLSTLDHFEDEFREIDGVLHVNRLVPYTDLDRKIRPTSAASNVAMKPFRSSQERHTLLSIAELANLDSFKFVDNPHLQQPLGPDEVDIDVLASGLNFRDVLIALGELEDDCFGFECCGIVRNKGSAVGHLNVGDRVAYVGRATFATTCRCIGAAVIRIPDSLATNDAAGLFLVTTTALYALEHVGRLQAGESVLIHSGAGGLGQAAIQIALARQAIVYTTVGSTKKKEFLVDKFGIPSDHVLSSRTLAFASTLKRLTGGRGVDVVLNSLSGEALQASCKCLAPGGRFLETGKMDIMSSQSLPMDMFTNNISFSGIDLSFIILKQPALIMTLLQQAMDLVEKGTISGPSPVSVFPGSKIEDAFQLMRSGKHIGKIVIRFDDEDIVPTAPGDMIGHGGGMFDPHASYVIAGGLGGLGRNVARWMVEQGARNLILLSRRTHYGADVQDLIRDLTQAGATVVTPPCDIADRDALRDALERFSHLGPIKGCLQLSMIVREAEFQDISHSDLVESLRAKVDGSWHLHQLLPPNLDFFIMFSSVSGIIGAPGMASYAMGNVYQDELARYRTSQNFKAISVDLGLLTDAGAVAEGLTGGLSNLLRVGFLGLIDADIKTLLSHYCDPSLPIASPDRSQVVVGLDTLAATQSRGADGGPWFQRTLFGGVNMQQLSSSGPGTEGRVADTAAIVAATLRTTQNRDEAVTAVLTGLVNKLKMLLCLGDSSIDTDQPLPALGIDSLVGIEIKNWFRRSAGANLAIFEIVGDRSIASLAELVVARSEFVKTLEET